MHLKDAGVGDPEAPDAVLAALQSLYTLKSTPAGVRAILEDKHALSQMCRVLVKGNLDGAKIVLDTLLHILIFCSQGYRAVIKVARPPALSIMSQEHISAKQSGTAYRVRFRLEMCI